MLKIRLKLIPHENFENYNARLTYYLEKNEILIGDDFFVVIGHVENYEDLIVFKRLESEKIGKIIILHNILKDNYQILKYADRIVVHHKFQRDILLSRYLESTQVIHLEYPIDVKKFKKPPNDLKIYIPDDANDYKVLKFLKENYEIVNEPSKASLIVMAYENEHFGNYHTFYELFGYSRPFILPKFPQFIEFAMLKSTVEILYSDTKSLREVIDKFRDKWFYNYHLSIVRGYAISNNFKRFSKQLLNVIRNVIPEDFLSLYV